MDEKHSSGWPLGSRLLSTEAGRLGRRRGPTQWRLAPAPDYADRRLPHRPAGLGLNTVPRTPQRLALLGCWSAGAGVTTLDLAGRGATWLSLTPDARIACV